MGELYSHRRECAVFYDLKAESPKQQLAHLKDSRAGMTEVLLDLVCHRQTAMMSCLGDLVQVAAQS